MPITIPDDLPAHRTLEAEGVMVMREADAGRQDIRPLRIRLLNLMPDKISTETQLARLLGATPLQIELTLVRITDHAARNTPANHMAAFYRPWSDVSAERFDGFIITGAPVERLAFEEIRYWSELRSILDWTQTHVHRCFTICWAAQAALFHFHGVPKRELRCKAVEDPLHRSIHMLNHLEYDTGTLAAEYRRDGRAHFPARYFPGDNPLQPPRNSWRSHAHLLFGNWINEIYQCTPFDPAMIGSAPTSMTMGDGAKP